MKILRKYRLFISSLIILSVVFILNKEIGMNSVKTTYKSFKQMMFYIPPVFILIGLLDVWIPKEAMVHLMGEKSGILGIILAFLFGSCAAGPLYGAFPVAAVLMEKGAKFTNILIFIGAWSCAKVGMVLFEIANLGMKFAMTRLLIDIPGIIIIAFLVSAVTSDSEKKRIYDDAENL
ncbi:MAG: permease [Sphaerochaetaceae bacterium]|nr:permease [Sphaerochaetaceae bacterium]